VGIHQRGRLLEQAERFEDDHDNDNYSDYIEDASVHAGANIKLDVRWTAFIQIEWPPRKNIGDRHLSFKSSAD
jgi:hypothetical protein